MPRPETAPPAGHDLLEVPYELPVAILAGQLEDAPALEPEPLTVAASPPALPPTTGTTTPRRTPAPARAAPPNDYRPNRGSEFEMPRRLPRITPPTMADDQTPQLDLAMAASTNTPGPDGDPQQRGSGRAGFWFFWILVLLLLWALRRLWSAFAADRATDPGPGVAGGDAG